MEYVPDVPSGSLGKRFDVGGKFNSADFSFHRGGSEMNSFNIVGASFSRHGLDAVERAVRSDGFNIEDAPIAANALNIQFLPLRSNGLDGKDLTVFADGFNGSSFVFADPNFYWQPCFTHQSFDIQEMMIAVAFECLDGMNFSVGINGLYIKQASLRMNRFDIPDFVFGRCRRGSSQAADDCSTYVKKDGFHVFIN